MDGVSGGMADEEIVRVFLNRVESAYQFTPVAQHVYRLESRQGVPLSRMPLLHLDPPLFAEYVRTIIATEHGHDHVHTATALIGIHLDEDLISSTRRDRVDALGVRRRDGAVEWFVTSADGADHQEADELKL